VVVDAYEGVGEEFAGVVAVVDLWGPVCAVHGRDLSQWRVTTRSGVTSPTAVRSGRKMQWLPIIR
jgi:hypothetical protein